MKRLTLLLLALALLLSQTGCELIDRFLPQDDLEETPGSDYWTGLEPVTIAQTQLYSGQGVTVTALRMEFGEGDPVLVLQVENSNDHALLLNLCQLAVNDYLLDSWEEYSIPAQSGAEYSLVFDGAKQMFLQRANVSVIGSLDFTLQLRDPENYEVELDETAVTLPTSRAGYVQARPTPLAVLYEDDHYRVSLLQIYDAGADYDLSADFMLENLGSSAVDLWATGLRINGCIDEGSYGVRAALQPGQWMAGNLSARNSKREGVSSAADIQNLSVDVIRWDPETEKYITVKEKASYVPGDAAFRQTLDTSVGKEVYNSNGLRLVLTERSNDGRNFCYYYTMEYSGQLSMHIDFQMHKLNGVEEASMFTPFTVKTGDTMVFCLRYPMDSTALGTGVAVNSCELVIEGLDLEYNTLFTDIVQLRLDY